MDRQDAERVAERAAEALGPEAGLVASLDPVSLARAMAEVGAGLARHPWGGALAGIRYAAGLAATGAVSAARAFGGQTGPPIPPPARDRRFADEAWAGNPLFFGLQQSYLLTARLARELVAAAELDPRWKGKAELATQLLIDAMAPSNFLATNPAALKRAFDTGGRSAAKGINNFLDDLVSNGGKPRQVDTSSFTLGENLAATKGKVVFRNSLMELLQYEPTTRTTYETPILCSPPWINKYYVMDLAPGRSLVQWAVDHGHTVFMISYRNPDEQLRNVKMDDYLISGPIAALEVVRDISGAEKVNLLGLCLGGTLTMATLAYLDAVGLELINSATFLNTLIDFSEPGLLGVFTDEATISRLERTMKRTGFLPKEDMQRSFNLLRTNDLIWNYAVSSWLMGEEPPAFDLLSWNNDSTRMPAEMHTFYLRSCYVDNQLARGVMELAGQKLDLGKVDQDLYFLSAEQDHIAPWRSSYAGARLPAGSVRFVLSNSGHIAGIVNPPSPKSV